jgi:hypothetical protein
MEQEISGRGRKRPLVDVPVERLELDPENPRLPMDFREKEQSEILAIFKQYFDLDELAYSMSENGYFDEEPLVAVPINLPTKFANSDSLSLINDGEYIDFITNSARFIVVEGNRRLATVKLLLSDELRGRLKIRGWPRISEAVIQDLSILPVIVYSDRAEVLSYMGVRHITGIKKWESFSKALYIAEMIDENIEINEIQRKVGDQTGSVRKLYLAYRLVEIAESELSLATGRPKEFFSYLILALGQKPVKNFLGLPNKWTEINFEEPIPSDHMDNLTYLFSWLFGEKDKPQVVKESRDITNYLSPILKSEEATKNLILTRDLQDSYDRSDGERLLLLRNLRKAVRNLSNSLALITNYKTDDEVKQEIAYCQDILADILKLIQE